MGEKKLTEETVAFVIGLLVERKRWANEGRKEVMSPLQADSLTKEMQKCDKAMKEIIDLG